MDKNIFFIFGTARTRTTWFLICLPIKMSFAIMKNQDT